MPMSSAFFNNVSPIKPTASKEKSVPGKKKRKVRFTGMAAASATGQKLHMFVIRKEYQTSTL